MLYIQSVSKHFRSYEILRILKGALLTKNYEKNFNIKEVKEENPLMEPKRRPLKVAFYLYNNKR